MIVYEKLAYLLNNSAFSWEDNDCIRWCHHTKRNSSVSMHLPLAALSWLTIINQITEVVLKNLSFHFRKWIQQRKSYPKKNHSKRKCKIEGRIAGNKVSGWYGNAWFGAKKASFVSHLCLHKFVKIRLDVASQRSWNVHFRLARQILATFAFRKQFFTDQRDQFKRSLWAFGRYAK